MKKTTDLAPWKTLSSSGQPPATKTGSMPGDFLQALDQELRARVELVRAGPVAGLARDQDDLGVGGPEPRAGHGHGRQARAGSRKRPIGFFMGWDLER